MKNNNYKIYSKKKTSEFNSFNNLTLNINGSNEDLNNILGDTYVYDILQEDNAIKSDYNDCYDQLDYIVRNDEYTSIKNTSDKVILPYLLNSEQNRLIVPNNSFILELNFISCLNVEIRFVNLKGSFVDIKLDDLHLSYGDNLKIHYKEEQLLIYKNNQKISSTRKFKYEDKKGYIAFRIQPESFLEYNNLKVYKTEIALTDLIENNQQNTINQLNLEKQQITLENKIKKLESKLNAYEKNTNELLESTNFLFNNLYLDYQLTPKGPLKDIQTLSTELLQFIAKVCEKYELEWWLDYGSLLGAIRHKSFIPWDDDVDIGMMRGDYNKLNRILKKEITKHDLGDLITVSYRPRKIDGKRVNGFIQLFILHETESHGNTIFGGVDIFPYDYLNDYNKETINNVYEDAKNEFYRNLTKGSYFKQLYMGLNVEDAMKAYYKNLNLNKEKSKYIVPGVEGACGPHNLYKLMILDADTVFPLKTTEYLDKIFPCPNDSDKYLKSIYGDYMVVPPKIRTHSRTNKFRYEQGIEKTFKEDYERLKKVNENF